MHLTRGSRSLAAAFVLVVTALQAAPAQAAAATCNGVRATIVSSAATITGTSGRDVIVVRGAGAHEIKAGAGNDLICGSPGADTVLAGAGNDVVLAGAGSDVVHGGNGNDTLNTGAGADQVHGGNGADRLLGGADADALQGGAAVDALNPGAGENVCADDPADQVAGSCTVDAAAPALAIQPYVMEVVAGTDLTIQWSASDPAGIANTMMFIGGPSGWVTDWCGFGVAGTLISGTPQDGVYSATCPVPATAVSQSYTAFIHATDIFSTRTESGQAGFLVLGGVADSAAPSIVSVEVPEQPVRVGEQFTVSYTLSDESGVIGSIAWLAFGGYSVADNTGRLYANWDGTVTQLVSGDDKYGTYTQTFTLNDFAPAGEYTIWLSVRDIYGNRDYVQTTAKVTVSG